MATYSIALWDFEEQAWSGELARDHIGGPNTGLPLGKLATALKVLRQHWGDVSIYVEREVK